MSSEGSRFCLPGVCLCLLLLAAGCTSVPAVPEGARTQPKSDSDEHEGWLWNSLTKRDSAAPASNSGASAATGAATTPQAAASTPMASTVPANAATPTGAAAMAPGLQQVQPTSYVASNASGPLIAGPATPGASAIPSPLSIAADAANAAPGLLHADPPPTIPAALPAPPPGVISIRDAEKQQAEKKTGFKWEDLAPDKIWNSWKAAAGYGPDEKIARAAMAEGEDLFRQAAAKYAAGAAKEAQALFTLAAVKFATAADRWPDTPLEEDALYLQAESEFFSDQYPKAHDTYGGLLKKFGNTRHLDTVVAREFRIGMYWEQLDAHNPMWTVQPNVSDGSRPLFDTFGYAISAYERVRTYDPTGPLADHALIAMANAYFRAGHYEDAACNYDLLIKDYPNSVHQQKAHELDLQCKERIYQGTAYDGGALKDAEKIADQTLKQFDNKLSPEERKHLLTARAQIIEEMANRDFARAQYYQQQKYYGAARFYYKSVIDGFPTTQKAKEARAQYDKIRSLPDVPPSFFEWLTSPFAKKS